MQFLQQLLAVPYAHLWIPGVMFFAVGGGLFWFLRPSTQLADSTPDDADADKPGAIQLATAAMKQSNVTNNEKRNSARRQGNPIEVCFSEPEQKQEPYRGSVLDRSTGGFRLAVLRKFDVGSVLSIRPVDAADMVPWINVEVRSCRPSTEFPGEFDLGCQYVKTPPYPILMLFG